MRSAQYLNYQAPWPSINSLRESPLLPSGHVLISSYLENGEKTATFKPFVWIVLLFVGPTIASLSIQYYIFLMTRALVRTESLLTQLLFDHALRLRMRDSTEDAEDKEEDATGGDGPVINVEEVDGAEINGTATSSNGSTEVGSGDVTKGKETDKQIAAEKEAAKTNGQGLAGRINVLMAADVESVIEGETKKPYACMR